MEVKTKDFRVRLAFDAYSVGQVIQPTGLWRSRLLSLGYIEPVFEGEPDTPQTEPAGSGAEAEKPKRRQRKANHVHDSL